jgi:hypothetical protein
MALWRCRVGLAPLAVLIATGVAMRRVLQWRSSGKA